MHTITGKKLLMLRPREIITKQPDSFEDYELRYLAESIAANGLIEPITVRKTAAGYELIAGFRRLSAAKLCSLRRIPCVLHNADDLSADIYSVLENLQRRDRNPFTEAREISLLMSRHNLTRAETAMRLGISQGSLSEKLRLLNLGDELIDRLSATGLSERYAKALLRLELKERASALDKIIADELSPRQAEELIENIINPKPQETAPTRKGAISDIRLFSNSLEKLIETLQSSGIDATLRRTDGEKILEYKIKIRKATLQNPIKQLKISV